MASESRRKIATEKRGGTISGDGTNTEASETPGSHANDFGDDVETSGASVSSRDELERAITREIVARCATTAAIKQRYIRAFPAGEFLIPTISL